MKCRLNQTRKCINYFKLFIFAKCEKTNDFLMKQMTEENEQNQIIIEMQNYKSSIWPVPLQHSAYRFKSISLPKKNKKQ